MHYSYRPAIFALCGALLLSACHSVPQHARYIPKDALIVVGLNTQSLNKKVAWDYITGSKLLEDMRKNAKTQKGPEAMRDLEHAGVNWMSTLYFYTKRDKRYENETKMAIIAPLKDAKGWEAYVKKWMPSATIIQVNKRSQAMLYPAVYAAWNDEVLIVMNTAMKNVAHREKIIIDSTITGGKPLDDSAASYSWNEQVPDEAATLSEMDAAFSLPKDASITDVSRFTSLEKEGHDITVWMNYDELMNSYGAAGMGMMGLTMGNALWKNSAMTAGFDFKNGTITGDMRYYASDSMKGVAKEFGKENIDKDMLGRIPAQNLNLVAGYHLSPSAIKLMMDKMNLSGMANLFLMQKGTTIDDILGSFTGDMVVAINNFSLMNRTPDTTGMQMGGMSPYQGYKPKMDFVYAMKINKRANFDKLMGMINESGELKPSAPNTYTIPLSGNETVTMVIGEKYLAVSNNAASANAFLQSKGGNMPEAAGKEVAGHPAGVYLDIQSFVAKISPSMVGSGSDSAAFVEVRNVLSNASMQGGEFEGDASKYHLSINFVNQNENSLLQLVNMAMRLAQTQEMRAQKAGVVTNYKH